MGMEEVPLTGEAKVQQNGPRVYIYLPVVRCRKRGIVRGSRVLYNIVNSGMPPEPPAESRFHLQGKMIPEKEEEIVDGPEPTQEELDFLANVKSDYSPLGRQHRIDRARKEFGSKRVDFLLKRYSS